MTNILARPISLRDWRDGVAISRPSDSTELPYNGIWICTGSQGAGKTLFVIDLLRDILKRYPNVKIYSDINLYGIDFVPYKGLDDFNDTNGKQGIIYVIDEIQTLYSSMQSAGCSDASLSIWSQNRKNVRLILATSQRFSRVAKPIREQTTFNIHCGHRLFGLYPYRVFDGSKYDDNGKYLLEPGERPPSWHIYTPRFRSYLSYDTREVVRGENYDKLS